MSSRWSAPQGQNTEKWSDASNLSSSNGDDHCDDDERTVTQIWRLEAWFLLVGHFQERNENMAVGGRDGAPEAWSCESCGAGGRIEVKM